MVIKPWLIALALLIVLSMVGMFLIIRTRKPGLEMFEIVTSSKANVKFLDMKETYALTEDILATNFTSAEKDALTRTAAIVDRFIYKYYISKDELDKLQKPWVIGLLNVDIGAQWDKMPYVKGGAILLNSYFLEEVINDRCQFGHDLLYLRLGVLFGKESVLTEGLPWRSQPSWNKSGVIANCNYFLQ